MRRALSTAGRQLSRRHAHSTGAGAGGGGGVSGGGGGVLLAAARRGIPSPSSSSSAQAQAPLSSWMGVPGVDWLPAIPSLPPPPPTPTGGWHGQGGGGLFSTCTGERSEGHEEGEGGIAGTSSSSSLQPLQSRRRCPSSVRAETETTTTIVPTSRRQHHHHHHHHRRVYSSTSRSLLKETTDTAAASTAGGAGEEKGNDDASSSRGGGIGLGRLDGDGDGDGDGGGGGSRAGKITQWGEDDWTMTPEADNTWVDRVLPSSVVPYAKLVRLDRPIGSYLLAWPCFWSIAIAAPLGSLPDPYVLSLFGAGSLLLRGAGCTVNDLWDRDIDKLVARTRNRPIASGAVSPLSALLFLSGQLSAGLVILLQLNDFSKVLGASSLALVAAYPLMKRVTDWPQAFLGLTFNWGALLGWAAVHGSLEPTVVLPLYASGVTWTLLYDTVYAHQDKEDDVKVGVKSTALLFGDDTKKYLAGFGGLSTAALCASGAAAGLAWPFYAGVGAAASHLAWQVADVDLNDRDDCAAKFKSNSVYGGIVFAAIVAGKLAA